MSLHRPPTLAEVARLAGVSSATASKVINNKGRISDETRDRVLKAADQLQYTPNQSARSLITGRTGTVGLIMFDSMTARFAVSIMLGAEGASTEIDLSVVTSNARGSSERFRELVRFYTHRNVDGILVIGDNNHLTPSITRISAKPVVYVYGRSDDEADAVHVVDDEQGGRLLANHLLHGGRTRIAHITGPRGSTSVHQRLLGIRAALSEAGIRLTGGVSHGAWSQKSGRLAAARLLSRKPEVEAIVCGSDQIAAGVVDALRATGRRVPEDVAVTGYDNWAPFALETEPPLTTVEMNLEALGQAAARDLFSRVDGATGSQGTHLYPPRLITRRSSEPRRGMTTAP